MDTIEGLKEDLAVTNVHGIYPTIDPNDAFSSQTYKGKVVFITGANGGIGEGVALTYARAGATVILGGRRQEAIEAAKASILKEAPSATLLPVVVDVVQPQAVEKAIETIINTYGRLDVVIALAGKSSTWEHPLSGDDPNVWWDVVEVNIRGVYNVARYTLKHLTASKGYFIAFSSMSSQLRIPNASSYGVSKHAVTRLVEFIQMEHPDVHAYSFHPGSVRTQLALQSTQKKPREIAEAMEAYLVDKPELTGCTCLYLTSGKVDWLAGKYVSANWDLGEVETKYKAAIIEKKALVSRLSLP
ncbi:NAD-P-binding protein [Dendrothele bispora CBS 962.96]|uniref:NAD-P-binding protein n=1 Tax=Dendrothele bispora (strain CBS 962.96) TaxID=1314807 RepID=A0A4S8M9Z1_DENBC|nr:NAD-P-binding protein [Dendrothele bispora CBS 962.96]